MVLGRVDVDGEDVAGSPNRRSSGRVPLAVRQSTRSSGDRSSAASSVRPSSFDEVKFRLVANDIAVSHVDRRDVVGPRWRLTAQDGVDARTQEVLWSDETGATPKAFSIVGHQPRMSSSSETTRRSMARTMETFSWDNSDVPRMESLEKIRVSFSLAGDR